MCIQPTLLMRMMSFNGGKMKNRITEILGIEKPLVQGSMSWVTNAEFVAAVSNAGGLGVLGPNAGQTEMTADPIETA